MANDTIGQVDVISYYPIKSMKGKHVDEIEISPSGLMYDRIGGFRRVGVDSDRNSQRFLTARPLPKCLPALLGMEPRVYAKTQGRPDIDIAIPGHGVFDAYSPAMARLLERMSGVSPLEFVLNEQRVQDRGQVSLVGLNSLLELSQQPGMSMIDAERFRMNLQLNLSGDYDKPFAEDRLVGKRIAVGEAELEVVEQTARCPLPNVDPEDNSRVNPLILKAIGRLNNGRLGVYANVAKPGLVRRGDGIYLK
ncbi:MAG TPA: MOSC domain-containing protein [Candidatus Nanoarchaeia archaeon]|nr:MOSC domain-containing protein [Candidatus Nanoarchaeia archaeon]